MTPVRPISFGSSIRSWRRLLPFVLLPATFAAMPGAGAQGADAPSVQRWVDASEPSAAARRAGPAPDAASLARLEQSAEAAFQQQQYREAQLGFARLVDLDDRYAAAWFRLGNLHQRASDLQAATDAYRRVLNLVTAEADVDGLREKALMNLALLGLWRTRLALAELERASVRSELGAQKASVEADVAQTEARLRALSRSRSIDPSLGSLPARPAIAAVPVAAPARMERALPRDDESALRSAAPPRVEHFMGMPSAKPAARLGGPAGDDRGTPPEAANGAVPREGGEPSRSSR